MKPNLLFMQTSAFLQTILANRLPIPLMEVRANIMFCLPSTFVFSTRRMCWKSSFATRDCTQDHIKAQFSKYGQKDNILKLEREKKASFERRERYHFLRRSSFPLSIMDLQGRVSAFCTLPVIVALLTQFHSLGFSCRAERDKRDDHVALMLTLTLINK